MLFNLKKKMNQPVSISDYYLQDVPEGTLFLPSSVTSLPDEFSLPNLLIKQVTHIFHD